MNVLSKEAIDLAAKKFDYSDFSSEFRTSADGLHAFADHIATLARADLLAENERLREQIKCGHSMGLDALARERDELLAENERLKLVQESALKVCAQLDEVVIALPFDYLDLPDGGDVSLGEQVSRMYSEVKSLRHECAQSRTDLAAAQAKIDSLMLEYCPDEMTPEQIENWGKHQKAVSDQTNLLLQLSP